MIDKELAEVAYRTAAKSFSYVKNPNKMTIQRIFNLYWDSFVSYCNKHDYTIRPVVLNEVDRMLSCGTVKAGFEIYECPNCHNHHIICYTCKSRFCNRCGAKLITERAIHIASSTLDVSHRHIVFTIDKRLRPYFKRHREWLRFLFDAAYEALSYVFNKMNRKSDTFTPGCIICLHTFGRPLNWNPHVHCLVTEGGMNKNHTYKSVKYINYESLRKSFMKVLLDMMRDAIMEKDSDEYKAFLKLRTEIYRKDTNGFYVYAPPVEKQYDGQKGVVQYIIRYSGRPAMAQSRIISLDKTTGIISYWYDDHKTNERITVSEHVYAFMQKLIQHIPEREFKMIRYFGLYAVCEHKHRKSVLIKLRKKLLRFPFNHYRRKHYRLSLIDTFNVDPLLCTCGFYMEFVDSYVPPRLMAGGNSP